MADERRRITRFILTFCLVFVFVFVGPSRAFQDSHADLTSSSFAASSAWKDEEEDLKSADSSFDDADGKEGPVYTSPSITGLRGRVTPGDSDDDDDGDDQGWEERALEFVLAEWWRVLVLAVVVTALLCMCCYLSRCCYLCWDCCTDPFWGCCPRCDSLEPCLKLQCCKNDNRKLEDYCQINLQQDDNQEEEEDPLNPDAWNGNVRTGARKQNGGRSGRPRSAVGARETEPQVYHHDSGDGYFSVLHLCGKKQKTKPVANGRQSSSAKTSVVRASGDVISFSGKDATGSKVEMDKRDIVIEHGHAGRYQPLPEAESEWVPLQVMRNRAGAERRMSNGCKRLSRSMESFGARHLQQQQQQASSSSAATNKSSGAAISTSHADIAVGTDPTVFSCHKSSQTDLDRETDPNERLDFRLQRPSAGNGANSGRAVANGHHNTCPLPRAPKKSSRRASSTSSSGRSKGGGSSSGGRNRNGGGGRSISERELLRARETTILS